MGDRYDNNYVRNENFSDMGEDGDEYDPPSREDRLYGHDTSEERQFPWGKLIAAIVVLVFIIVGIVVAVKGGTSNTDEKNNVSTTVQNSPPDTSNSSSVVSVEEKTSTANNISGELPLNVTVVNTPDQANNSHVITRSDIRGKLIVRNIEFPSLAPKLGGLKRVPRLNNVKSIFFAKANAKHEKENIQLSSIELLDGSDTYVPYSKYSSIELIQGRIQDLLNHGLEQLLDENPETYTSIVNSIVSGHNQMFKLELKEPLAVNGLRLSSPLTKEEDYLENMEIVLVNNENTEYQYILLSEETIKDTYIIEEKSDLQYLIKFTQPIVHVNSPSLFDVISSAIKDLVSAGIPVIEEANKGQAEVDKLIPKTAIKPENGFVPFVDVIVFKKEPGILNDLTLNNVVIRVADNNIITKQDIKQVIVVSDVTPVYSFSNLVFTDVLYTRWPKVSSSSGSSVVLVLNKQTQVKNVSFTVENPLHLQNMEIHYYNTALSQVIKENISESLANNGITLSEGSPNAYTTVYQGQFRNTTIQKTVLTPTPIPDIVIDPSGEIEEDVLEDLTDVEVTNLASVVEGLRVMRKKQDKVSW
jgi:hypothetical protein